MIHCRFGAWPASFCTKFSCHFGRGGFTGRLRSSGIETAGDPDSGTDRRGVGMQATWTFSKDVSRFTFRMIVCDATPFEIPVRFPPVLSRGFRSFDLGTPVEFGGPTAQVRPRACRMPRPLPAILDHSRSKTFRECLPSNLFEAGSLWAVTSTRSRSDTVT